ncbi:MAG: pyrroline-5-carboxylate reductase [Lachnospiraceae bacterium]
MKIGFIGGGNMASAMLAGILKYEVASPAEIILSDASPAALAKCRDSFGIETTQDNVQVARTADLLVLSVKPQFYQTVIQEIRGDVRPQQIIVTIAPGKTLAWLAEQFGKEVKIVRTMPNTPALVGEGITGICHNALVTAGELEQVCRIFNSFGKAELLSEHLIDAVVGVSGSSPAYVFMMIEAMADAAVSEGLPRQQAYTMAAQAVLGSAKMVLELQKHPGELKDMVCSPGGTTIEAVRILEEKGFRSALIEAIKGCVKKAREL